MTDTPINFYSVPCSARHYVTPTHQVFEQLGERRDPSTDKHVATISNSSKFRASIIGDDGNRHTITPANIIEEANNPLLKQPLTIDEVLFQEHAKVLEPTFPDYAITEEGTLYCITPPKRGKWAGRIYIKPSSFDDHNVERVSLRKFDGQYTTATIPALVKEAWGDTLLG
tara:strand:- start:6202 stop:6711 length:510 start_codon:yes stop_codon:yes gene_type:complete